MEDKIAGNGWREEVRRGRKVRKNGEDEGEKGRKRKN